MLIDVHCHMDYYMGSYIDTAIEEIRHLKVLTLSNSVDFVSYRKNVDISKRCEYIIPTFGIHPKNAIHYRGKEEKIRQAVAESMFVGVVGLDNDSSRDSEKYEAQREILETILDEAGKHQKLVIVHTKGAEEEVLRMLRHYGIQRVIIHWYSGPIDVYRKMVQEGYKFSIGFMVLHSDFIRVIARRIPSDQILIETDNPIGYEKRHKKIGMPFLVKDILKEVAYLRNQSVFEIENLVWENFMNMLTPFERSHILQAIKHEERKIQVVEEKEQSKEKS